MFDDLARPLRFPLLLVAIACAGALAFAYIAQYRFDFAPCALCVYQRIPYWAALTLATAAFAFGKPSLDTAALALVGVAFLVGGAIAIHHVGVEKQWWASAAACAGGSIPPATVEELQRALTSPPPPACDRPAWIMFGVSMAGYNMVASFILAAFALTSAYRAWKR